MPGPAREMITSRAQGIPLFAVEMLQSLIDVGGVVADQGAYHLSGDLDQLTVPDSLHALLAARLDALGPSARRLVGVASVLGSTFPAEALIAVSGREASEVRASLGELVRRNVLQVSADRLSPQRGDYRFSQELLRQVAYEALSRRERKARHLAVAAHLRQAFATDGEEIAGVIARHYLDALGAEPDGSDAPAIREQALSMLVRAAERAQRIGTPGRAAASFADAAELAVTRRSVEPGPAEGTGELSRGAAALWERAAGAAFVAGQHDLAVEDAGAARRCYLQLGDARGGARVQITAGRALLQEGRHTEARTQLVQAIDGLREQPDADTANALAGLANLELFDGNPDDGERLAAEALAMGQALDVDAGLLAWLFLTHGNAQAYANRTEEAAWSYREAARLAERAGETLRLCTALGNLSDALTGFDPAAAADAARAAAEHARRIGARYYLGGSVWNLSIALLELGEWDEVALSSKRRSTRMTSATTRRSPGPGHGSRRSAATASRPARHPPRSPRRAPPRGSMTRRGPPSSTRSSRRRSALADALAHACSALSHAPAIGIGREQVRWAWPLAARVAAELGKSATLTELFALLDTQPPGQLPPLLRAENDLARARAQACAGDLHAGRAFSEAVAAQRRAASPYRLAPGLLDHAAFLARTGQAAAAHAAAREAQAIARRLRCSPLLRSVDALTEKFAYIAGAEPGSAPNREA